MAFEAIVSSVLESAFEIEKIHMNKRWKNDAEV